MLAAPPCSGMEIRTMVGSSSWSFFLLFPRPPLDFTSRCIPMEFWYVIISIKSSGKCSSTKAEEFAVTVVSFLLVTSVT